MLIENKSSSYPETETHKWELCAPYKPLPIIMKNYQYIKIFILISLISVSCKQNENSGFNYNISGIVKDSTANGIELSLIIPSQGIERRNTTKILNGKFEFSGYLEKPEFAEIQFEYDVLNNSSNQAFIPVIVDPTETQFSLSISESKFGAYKDINELNFLSGVNNKIFYKELYTPKLINHFSYSDNYQKNRDSIQKNNYLDEKIEFFKKFDSIYDNKNAIAYVSFWNYLFSTNQPQFDKDYINDNDKKYLKKIALKVDSNKISLKDYKEFNSKINSLIEYKTPMIFSDFTLKNKNGGKSTLSEIIKNNKYTVLDFWWSNCGPCRKFNKESEPIYSKLKENNIEIVGINIDTDSSIWNKVSKEDRIKWVDLYAGPNSDIQIAYKVYSFPTKIVIDNEYNIVNFDFKKAEELLNIEK